MARPEPHRHDEEIAEIDEWIMVEKDVANPWNRAQHGDADAGLHPVKKDLEDAQAPGADEGFGADDGEVQALAPEAAAHLLSLALGLAVSPLIARAARAELVVSLDRANFQPMPIAIPSTAATSGFEL